jgi:integrase
LLNRHLQTPQNALFDSISLHVWPHEIAYNACMVTTAAKRSRGEIEPLPSGSLRVKVYAGTNPVTGKKFYLTETVKPGPRQERTAEQVRTKLLNQVDEQRTPKTRAKLSVLFDTYFELLDVEVSTLRAYESNYRNHIEPHLGQLPLTKLQSSEPLDGLYAQLRKCRAHCKKRRIKVDHRTSHPHLCDEHKSTPCSPPRPADCRACRRMCQPHVCVGLANSSIRQIHFLISGALEKAVKWQWISVNAAEQAEKPGMSRPDPRPPSATEAAQLIECAYAQSIDRGEFVWTKATTGGRRGEMCALQWLHLEDSEADDGTGVVVIRQALYKAKDKTWKVKDTKTHQHRRVVVDRETWSLLRERRARLGTIAKEAGVELRPDAYIFSPEPDGLTPLNPDSVTQWFGRLATRLGILAQLKNWRHYNATELLGAGFDASVVAGRLGHGGGGSTTLKHYVAFQEERAQRAAGAMVVRMPPRPGVKAAQEDAGGGQVLPLPEADAAELEPYRRIAADLRGAIMSGFVSPGTPLPPMKMLARRYGVAVSTAHRAVALLVDADLVQASRGVRATVADGALERLAAAHSAEALSPVATA